MVEHVAAQTAYGHILFQDVAVMYVSISPFRLTLSSILMSHYLGDCWWNKGRKRLVGNISILPRKSGVHQEDIREANALILHISIF